MVFALGGGRKRAGRRNNPRARHARQSRKDHAASSSRPLCPPLFFIFPRAQPRAFAFATVGFLGVPHVLRRMRLRFAAAASVETHRSPTIQYSAAGAPFRIPLSGAVLRRRPMRASFRFHGPLGVIRQAARRNSNDGLIEPRMFRPSPPAFRSGGRKNLTRPKPWPSPAPISTNPAARRSGDDKKTKPILIFHAIPTVCRRNMNNPRSGILIGARRNFLPALAKPREESVCWGARPSLPHPARRQCVIGDSMARVCRRMSKAAIDAPGDRLRRSGAPFLATDENFP